MQKLLLVLLVAGFSRTFAQELVIPIVNNATVSKKGNIYFYWGWNRSSYSTSDIHFKGNVYNFTLHNVKAEDRPTPFDPFLYLNPRTVTIPQYQYRFGYYINDKMSLSWGFNHMKYVMKQYQSVRISGNINTPSAGSFNNTYNYNYIKLGKDFLQFEHTNGLNYLSLNLDRTESMWRSQNNRFGLCIIGGVGFGLLYPKSDVRLFGTRWDKWHVSGYGLSGQMALRLDFFKNFFIQGQLETGFINMPDILTTGEKGARADQHFFYYEKMIQFGGYYHLTGRKKKKT